jgi:hypothetical protein
MTTSAPPIELVHTMPPERTMRSMIWRRFRRHRMVVVELALP